MQPRFYKRGKKKAVKDKKEKSLLALFGERT